MSRGSSQCPLFGPGKDLSLRILPTYEDVMRYYQHVRIELKQVKEPAFNDIAAVVIQRLQHVWKLASIPALSKKRIHDMLRSYRNKINNIIKSLNSKKKSELKFQQMIQEFKDSAKGKLFDITTCKCSDLERCNCPLERRVPVEEHKFLIDQRSNRAMAIGTLDLSTTKRNTKRSERRYARRRQERHVVTHEDKPLASPTQSTSSTSSGMEDSNSESINYEPAQYKRRTSKNECASRIRNLAEACDRTGVSDRAAALIATSVLQDTGKIDADDDSAVIDKNKIRRARKRIRSEHQETAKVSSTLQGLFFDGRKDQTLSQEDVGGRLHKRTVTEEHIVLIQEPDSHYVGHFTPPTGSAKCIATGIVEFLESNEIETKDIVAIGSDGTVVNTGQKGGAIRILELQLQKPLQWIICLLHANELPLRHLIRELDGRTSGPEGLTGPIGKQLVNCDKLPVVKFNSITSPEILVGDNELSTDQQYLLEIHRAVSSGECSSHLAARNPGKMSHSRWLTTANRVLRLYVSTSKPSTTLEDIAQYIMTVYVPVWFAVKRHSSFTDGAKHFFMMMKSTQALNNRITNITNKVLQRNSFFAHPENILLTMIYDNQRHVRELGWRRILKCRKLALAHKGIRCFTIPKIMFD